MGSMTMTAPRVLPGTRDYEAIGNQYVQDVLDGTILACEYVKAACQRYINDLEKSEDVNYPYYFEPRAGARVCSFIERLPHVKGDKSKKSALIVLSPYQVFIRMQVYGWLKKETKTRRFSRVYEEVARKNGKSTIMSATGLYHLCADRESGPEVYALATNRTQAAIVWRDAWSMLGNSKSLQKKYGLKRFGNPLSSTVIGSITNPKANGIFTTRPGQPGDGDNPTFAIIDEYHEHKTSVGYDAMYSGMGARSQAIIWVVTTAGPHKEYPCFNMRSYAAEVLRGQKFDDTLFAIIFTLDEGDAWDDPKNWIKANPNMGVSFSYDKLLEAGNEAKQNPSKLNNFLTKRLNIWTTAGSAFFNTREWDSCRDVSLDLEDFCGRRAYIGFDGAQKVDLAALTIWVEDTKKEWALFTKLYLPKDTVEENAHSTHAHYANWALDGDVILTPGRNIDFDWIEEDIAEICEKLDVQAIAYDPYHVTQLMSRLDKRGLPVVEIRGYAKNMSPAMREFESMLAAQSFRHNGNKCMDWMIANVLGIVDNKDCVMPRKERPENKIDGPVAALLALNRLQFHEEPSESIYESMARGEVS